MGTLGPLRAIQHKTQRRPPHLSVVLYQRAKPETVYKQCHPRINRQTLTTPRSSAKSSAVGAPAGRTTRMRIRHPCRSDGIPADDPSTARVIDDSIRSDVVGCVACSMFRAALAVLRPARRANYPT